MYYVILDGTMSNIEWHDGDEELDETVQNSESYRTIEQARFALLDHLRTVRDDYNMAIERVKKLRASDVKEDRG